MGDFEFDVKSLDSYNKVDTDLKNQRKLGSAQPNRQGHLNGQEQNQEQDQESDIKSLTAEELQRFKELANKFFSLNEDIQKIEDVLRERKKLKMDLTKKILSFMAEYDIEDLNTNKGKLVYSVSNRKTGLSIAKLKKNINNFFKNEEQSNNFLKFLDEREVKEVVSLKLMKK